MNHLKYLSVIIIVLILGCEDQSISPVSTLPQVKIISPAMNTIVNEDTKIIVEASDDQHIVRVEVFIDGYLYFKSDSSLNLYTFQWHAGASDGKQYILEANAYDNDGNKTTSKAVVVKFYNFTPYLSSASLINDSLIQLIWNDNSKIETGFEIEKAINDSNFILIMTVDSGLTSAIIQDSVKLDNIYLFRMRAFNNTSKSSYSEIRTAGVKLTAPTSVNAVFSGDTLVTISWTDTNFFKDSYEVSLDGTIKSVPPDSYSTQIKKNFINGYSYTASVRVRKFFSQGPSLQKFFNFLFPAPKNLRTNSQFNNKVVLKWDDENNYEKGFAVFRVKDNQPLTEIAFVGANMTEYTDIDLDTNSTYKYLVRAYSAINISSFSNQIQVRYTPDMILNNTHTFFVNLNSGTFSGNFQYFFSNNNRAVKMYSVPEMTFIRNLAAPPDTQYIAAGEIVASFDGSRVSKDYYISFSGSGSGNRLSVWNTSTGTLQNNFNTSCVPVPIAFSKDNSKVIVTQCQTTKAYALPTGTSSTIFSTQGGNTFANAKWDLLALAAPGSMKVFTMTDGVQKYSVSATVNEYPIGFSPDANYLIATNSSKINIYDLTNSSKLFSESIYGVKRAFISVDNKNLVLVGNTDMRLYDIASKKLINTYSGLGTIYHSNYLDDINQIAIASLNTLKYYKFVNTWKIIQ